VSGDKRGVQAIAGDNDYPRIAFSMPMSQYNFLMQRRQNETLLKMEYFYRKFQSSRA
jgi:hypothetical protein